METADNGIKTPFINLQSDFGFKRTFGTERFRLALIRFLEAALGENIKVTDVKFHNKELLPAEQKGKSIVYDVYCTMDIPAGDSRYKHHHIQKDIRDRKVPHHFILEMQNVYEPPFEDRMMFYAAKMVASQGLRGWKYDIDPVILIAITDFDLPGTKPELEQDYQLREKITGNVLTEKLQLLFYSLQQVPKEWDDCETELQRRLFLIKNMDKMDKNSKPYKDGGYEDMFEAAESNLIVGEDAVLYSQSLHKLQSYQAALDYTRDEALEEGLLRGMERGREEGMLEVARRMKERKMAVDEIALLTGIDVKSIEEL